MYMNVNGILAAQRPARVRPASLVALWARPPAARLPAGPGGAGAGLSCLLARASRVSRAAPSGPWAPVRVDCSLWLLPCPAGSCLAGTAGAGRGARALVSGSRHDSRRSARISPHLRSLAAVVL